MIKKLIKKKSIELKKVTLKFSKFNNNKFCFRMKCSVLIITLYL